MSHSDPSQWVGGLNALPMCAHLYLTFQIQNKNKQQTGGFLYGLHLPDTTDTLHYLLCDN